MKILIDTNVMIDFIAKRQGYFEAANEIMKLCKSEKITAYIASHSIIDAFYILRKAFSAQELRQIFDRYLIVVKIVGVGKEEIINSLAKADFKDFEDCVQVECAIRCGADYIITRNVKDFDLSNVPAIMPEVFIDRYGKDDCAGKESKG